MYDLPFHNVIPNLIFVWILHRQYANQTSCPLNNWFVHTKIISCWTELAFLFVNMTKVFNVLLNKCGIFANVVRVIT